MNVRQEVFDLVRFLRVPRRMPARRADDSPWLARVLLFAALTISAAILASV